MNYILFDGDVRNALLPFTYTKPVADIRIGILTIREKWEKYLGLTTTTSYRGIFRRKISNGRNGSECFNKCFFLPNSVFG